MLERLRYAAAGVLTRPVIGILVRLGISPNTLSLMGFALNLSIAYALARGYLLTGGLLILFSGWFDLLDGALARAKGKVTRFGALLDSVLDRFSEAALFFGLLFFYLRLSAGLEVMLVYLALVGSMAVSYTRARAEGLGMELRVGLLTRSERIILLALGLILSWFCSQALLVVLWILAIGTNLTAIHRVIHVWRRTREDR
ncbi:MAG: CDP-alcohol phosphatidyltransferase family protein [Chloroflexi bacterium]|nr:MAG: CDP-alcohol phosphatidyltransferase family protein [Chloroflexota bacterium]